MNPRYVSQRLLKRGPAAHPASVVIRVQRIMCREYRSLAVAARKQGVRLSGVVVMLQRDVVPGIPVDAGGSLFQSVGLER